MSGVPELLYNTLKRPNGLTLPNSKKGKWLNTECKRRKLILCEKAQLLSLLELSRTVFEMKTHFEKREKEYKETISELKHQITTVPQNMIYIQYPKESEPSQLWNCSGRWSDISANFANLFFRVNGDKTATFGAVQDENTPLFDGAKFRWDFQNEGSKEPPGEIRIPKKGWSENVFVGHHHEAKGVAYHSLMFHNSGGEVRPRNMAVKVWKCVA